MTQTTKIVMTSDDKGVLDAILKQTHAMDKLADKMDRVGRSGRKGSADVQSGFDRAGASIKNAASQLLGFGSAAGALGVLVATLKKEMEEIRRRDDQARAAQRGVAESVRGARINFVEDASLKDKDLEKALQGVAQRARSPVGIVAEAFSSAASAKGSLSNMEALRAVEAALTLRPGDLATGTELGSRALDITKLAPGLDPRAAVGFMTNVQAASRVTDLAQLGQTAPTAISAAAAAGDTPEQGAELYATVTNLLADAEGRKSSTLAKQLIAMTSAFVPAGRGKDERGGFRIPKEQMEAFEAAQGPTARLEVLQQNAELRRDFMARNSFAAETRVAAERLLSGDAGAMREYQQARRVINPLNAQQEGAFDAKVEQLEGGLFQPVLTAGQRTEQLAEGSRLGNTLGGRRDASRKALESALDAVGDSWLTRKLRMSAFDNAAGRNPERAAAGIIQAKIRETQEYLDTAGPGTRREDLQDAREDIELLREQVRILGQLRDDTRRKDPPNQRRQPAAQALGRR